MIEQYTTEKEYDDAILAKEKILNEKKMSFNLLDEKKKKVSEAKIENEGEAVAAKTEEEIPEVKTEIEVDNSEEDKREEIKEKEALLAELKQMIADVLQLEKNLEQDKIELTAMEEELKIQNEQKKENIIHPTDGNVDRELGTIEKLGLDYIKDIEARRKYSIEDTDPGIHLSNANAFAPWEGYYHQESTFSGKSQTGFVIYGTSKEDVIEQINKKYDDEKFTPIRTMIKHKEIGDRRRNELEELEKEPPKKSFSKKFKDLFTLKYDDEYENSVEAKKGKRDEINHRYDVELHEVDYPFVYKAYDKIDPSVRFYDRDFTFVKDYNGNEIDPRNTLDWKRIYLRSINKTEGFFESNFLGFYKILKNADEIRRTNDAGEKYIDSDSPEAIYKVLGPDGSTLIDDVGYAEASEKYNEEVNKYKEKLEKELGI